MPDVRETADFLTKVPLFRSLKRRQLETLARQIAVQDFEAGQNIVTQGQGGVGLFIIVSGQADAVRVRIDGTKAVVNTLGPTDFFGEMALLTEGTRSASVVATEATQCMVLTRWNFLAVLKEDAEMAISILEELAWRFRMALEVM
jgi:CRP-like cAMP-binding protein